MFTVSQEESQLSNLWIRVFDACIFSILLSVMNAHRKLPESSVWIAFTLARLHLHWRVYIEHRFVYQPVKTVSNVVYLGFRLPCRVSQIIPR